MFSHSTEEKFSTEQNSWARLKSKYQVSKTTHLFRLTAGGPEQERIQHIFPSQEEAITVLVQVDGGQGELAVMAAEDGWAVGGEQICEREGGEKDELWWW